MSAYDAVLLLSFGGPEKPADVRPFLERVLRGRDVPAERLRQVAAQYELLGGRSPINDQCRALLAALGDELRAHGIGLPLYWGNRNWHPLLADTLRAMRDEGRRRALALVTSAYGSYSGCRQYLEDLARARAEVGPGAPQVDKLRLFYNHPGFVEACAARLRAALGQVPAQGRTSAAVTFTAHSLPAAMAATCPYEEQLRDTCARVAEAAGVAQWRLAFQSRSGPPSQPWLEPDVNDDLRALAAAGVRDVVVAPLGFVSDHMEVLHDLDVAARATAREVGLRLVRAGSAGVHPAFVAMLRELIQERLAPETPRRFLGAAGAWPDTCPADCCPPPPSRRRPAPPTPARRNSGSRP